MTFSYAARAAILASGSFFLLQATLGAVVSFAPRLRYFNRIPAHAAARLLFLLRLLPTTVALAITAACVLPAYFQWEQQSGSEPVGPIILLAAIAGVASWAHSLTRAARALRYATSLPQQITNTATPFLAVAGLVRPRIIVSKSFLETIPAAQQDVAMRHEMAHFQSADNWKRLAMLLAPAHLGASELEHAWARYAERAADDRAVNGDPTRATLLAEVLVTVARAQSPQQQPALVSALVDSPIELRTRVERLLNGTTPAAPQSIQVLTAALLSAPIAAATVLGAAKPLFEILEPLLHL